jgi:aldehyde:ferredoxin oxidoreductase
MGSKPSKNSKSYKAKSTYYFLMGWDVNGVPLPEKVGELHIE